MKQNKYKPEPVSPKGEKVSTTSQGRHLVKIFMGVVMVVFMSLFSIWIYDAVTQCPFFTIKQVDISGNKRVKKDEIILLAGVKEQTNLFKINIETMKQQITCHPWIAYVSVKRSFFSTLVLTIVEEEPLAIVNIENLADIIINTQGHPFKEYDPQKDQLNFLPVISGMDLTLAGSTCQFEGPLFNSIMNILKVQGFGKITDILGDENIGITIYTQDIYNINPVNVQESISLKLGFGRFEEKQIKAVKISRYIDTHFPDRAISSMDIFNIKKIFITTKETNTLHHNLEKGV